jgi:2-phospho-L-lactate guanylyltransferase
MWAVVPLKSPDEAKSRLATVLNAAQRRALMFALAERVIRTLHATPGIDVVAVVTASNEVAAFARSLQAEVIRHAEDFGTASAFASAVRHLQPLHLQRLLMIAGDLPLVSNAALENLLACSTAPRSVVVVPDRHSLGTNALLCSPPEIIAPCFGSNSFQQHLRAAELAGVSARVLQDDSLALDLDVADDLEFLRSNGGAAAQQLLQSLAQIDTPLCAREVAGVAR